MPSRSEVYTTKVFLNAEQAKKELDDLTKKVSTLQKERDKYASQGDLKKVNEINKELKETTNRLSSMQTTSAKISKVLDNLSGASVKQIQSTIKAITREMNSGRIQRGSEEWKYFEKQLQKCNKELKDIRVGLRSTGDESSKLGGFLRSTFANYSAYVLHDIQNLATQFIGNVRQMVDEGIELARSAEGIEAAFDRINKPGLLDELRKATHGTVSDLELMQQAVKFKDFNLPVEQLGKYLAFAQQKSKDTGESIDYMVNSIVTGLGRQSKQILDNLGLSAKEIGDEVKRTGNFFDAVANIVDKRMADAGEHLETSMDRAAQATARLKNAQLEVGKELLPLKDKINEIYSEMQLGAMRAVVWVWKNRDAAVTLAKNLIVLSSAIALVTAVQKARAIQDAVVLLRLRALYLLDSAHTGLLKAKAIAIGAVRVATALLTMNITKATAALNAMRAASVANPVGALVSVFLSLAAVAYTVYSRIKKNSEEARRNAESVRLMNKQWSDTTDIQKQSALACSNEIARIRTLRKTVNDATKTYAVRNKALTELKGIVPAYHAGLTKEGQLINNNVSALDAYIKNLRKAAIQQAALSKMGDITGRVMNNELLKGNREANQQYAIRRLQNLGFDPSTMTIKDNIGGTVNGNFIKQNGQVVKTLTKAETKEIERWMRVYEYNVQKIGELTKSIESDNKRITAIENYAGKEGFNLVKDTPSTSITSDDDKKNKSGKTGKTEDPYDADLKQLETSNKQRQYLLKEQHAYGLLTDEQYHQQQLAADMAYYQSRMKLQEQYGKDTVDTRNAMLDKMISEANYKEQQEKQNLQNQQKALDDAYQSDRVELLKLYADGEIATKEEYDRRLRELERDHQSQLLNIIREAGGDTLQVESDIAQQEIDDREKFFDQMRKAYENAFNKTGDLSDRQRLLQSMYDQNLISAEEYQERMTEIEEEGEQRRDEIRQMFMQQASQLMGDLSSLYSAMQEEEIAKLEARYQREIDSAKKAGRDTTKLEKEKEEKVNAIKRKYAEKEFRMKVLQIVADTAVGIAQLWKNPGYPWAIPLTAMVAASGAMQLATAQKAQQQALSTGYYSGGFTGGRRYRKEAGVVHEGEFVANHEAVNNPTILPALELIDRAQRRNLVSSLDLGKELGGNTTVVSAPTVNVNTDNSSLDHTLAGITEAVKRLNDRLDEGIEAYSVIDGPNGSYNKLSEYEKLLSHK